MNLELSTAVTKTGNKMIQLSKMLKFALIFIISAIFSNQLSGQCNAIISTSITEGCEVLTVYFEDISDGSVSRTWDFGDGSEISNAQNPNHGFSAGVLGDTSYTVTLTITCSSGTDIATQIITVYALPEISFDASKTSVCAITDSVCFSVDQSYNSSSNYTWKYGDGTISNEYEPCKTYSTPGLYDLQLEVINEHGCYNSHTEAELVRVEPVPSTEFTVSSFEGCSPFTINFENTTDTIGEVYSNWTWDYGDGSPELNDFNSTSHTYTVPGTYTITLGTTNVLGCYNYSTQQITVKPTPTAGMDFIETVCENDTALIYFTGTYDSSPSFSWDFDTASYINGSGIGPYKVKWNEAGIKNLSVTIEENGCQASAYDKIQISPLAEVYLDISADHDSVCIGESVTFTASPPYFSNYKYIVNSTVAQSSTSNEFSSNTLNTNDEIYVEISDINGCSRIISDTVSITVIDKPDITISSTAVNDSICFGDNVIFTASPAGLNEYQFLINNIEVQLGSTNTFSTMLLENSDRLQVLAEENGCYSVLKPGKVTTVKEALPAPQVNCGNTTLSSIEFSWDQITDADSYEIRIDGGSWQDPSTGPSGTSHLMTGLGGDETHEIEVRAYDGSVCGVGLISKAQSCTSVGCDEITFYLENPYRQVCEGEWVTLSVDSILIPNYSIEWEGIPSENKATFNHLAIIDTVINIKVSNLDQITCPSASKSFNLTVTEKPNVSISHTMGSNPICEGTAVELTISPADLSDFYFYINNALVQHSTANTYMFDSQTGNNEIYAKVLKNGCVSYSDTINLEVKPRTNIPEVNFVSSDLTSVLYSWDEITNATGYLVSENFGPFLIPSSGTTGNTHLITGLQPGEATTLSVIALSDGPCGMSDQSQPAIGYAEVCASFDFDVSEDDWICIGDSIKIQIQNLDLTNYGISWSNGPPTTTKAVWIKPQQDTIVSIAVKNTDQELCPRVVKYVKIGVSERPSALTLSSSDSDNIICEGDQVSFTATPGGYDSYEFYFGSNLVDGNYFNTLTTKQIKDGDEISARAVNLGCPGPISNTITTQVKKELIAPQANCGTTTSSTINFTWDAVTDAIGYEVSINDQHFITPSSGITGLTHDLTGLLPGDSASISVVAISDSPCGLSPASNVATCYAVDCSIITFDMTPEQQECENASLELSIEAINVSSYAISWDGGASTTDTTFDHLCLNDTEIPVSLTDLDQAGCPPITKVFNIDVIETDDIILTSNATRDSICANESLEIVASPAIYDRYVFYDGTTIVQDSDKNLWVIDDLPNTNSVHVEVYNQGCLTSSTVTHTEIVPINPVSLSASESGSICTNELVTFSATPGFSSYIFNDGLNILSFSGSEEVDIPIRSEEITVSAYNHFNCISVSDDTIKFAPLPLPKGEIASSRDLICFGEVTSFSALPDGMPTYEFYNNSTELMQSSNSRYYNTDSLRIDDNISVVVIDNNGCRSTNVLSPLPNMIPYPSSSIGKDVNGICLFDQARIWMNKDETFTPTINYIWSTNETSDTITVAPEVNTKYSLIYSDQNCADVKLDEITMEVDTQTPPIAYAGIDTVICIEDGITLEGSGGMSLWWTPTGYIDDSTSSTPYVNPIETTNYVLTVKNQYCTDTDTVEVYVDLCLIDLTDPVPQIITPNNDGANDYWHVEHVDYFTENRLVIFNRWNNIVYEASPYLNDWDGTSMKGEDLPEGTYFYILELGPETPLHKGYIIIHR